MHDVYDQIKDDPTVPFLVKLEFMPIAENKKQQIKQIMNQPPQPMQIAAAQLDLKKKAADIEDKQAQATERRARSVTDQARAAHLASEAHLNIAQIVNEGRAAAANLPGAPVGSPGETPVMPQQGTPQFQGMPPPPPGGAQPSQPPQFPMGA